MTEPVQQQPEKGPLPRTREAVDWWLTKWGRDEVVAGNEPLTREDMERLIAVNGNTAEDLELSERSLCGAHLTFLPLNKVNLWRARLESANLSCARLEATNLRNSNLKEARLVAANINSGLLLWANLQDAHLLQANLQNTDLRGADFKKADLRYAQLEGATLLVANLEGVRLHNARIDRDTTRLHRVNWGERMILGEEEAAEWAAGLDSYRVLKQWHQHNGDYDMAGVFHYGEWECRRKLAQEQRHWGEAALLWLYRLSFGYGEHPLRVIGCGLGVMAFFALFFYLPYLIPQGTSLCLSSAECWTTFGIYLWQSFYFSGVSFTALGYGLGEAPSGWTRYLGVVESLVGITLIALFLVTFTRKMTR